MIDNRYAVVKGSLNDAETEVKTFKVWHQTYKLAKEEAERLCRKEGGQFIVIKAVNCCYVEKLPISWKETEDGTAST
jgi:hypothetical protein